MEKFKVLRRGTSAVALGVGLALAGAAPASAVETLIFATYFGDVYSASKAANWMMDEIEKRSNGEIQFEKYWSSSLLKAPDLFPALQTGAADIVIGNPAGYNVREYPLQNITMPFMTTKADAVSYAFRDLYQNNEAFRNEVESRGAKIIVPMVWAGNSIWSRQPIEEASDFPGLKVRGVPSISEALQALGATPVALTWPDGLEGLQRGVVDAMSSAPFDSAVHGGAHEVAPYGTGLGGIFATAPLAIGLDRYNSLSEEHRKIIDEVAEETLDKSITFLNQSVDEAVEKMCAAGEGITVTSFAPEEAEKVEQIAGGELQSNWLNRVATETDADGEAMLEEYKGYLERYEADSTYVPGFERYRNTCGEG